MKRTNSSFGLLLFFFTVILAIITAILYLQRRSPLGLAPASYYRSGAEMLGQQRPVHITNVIRGGGGGDGRYSMAPEASRSWVAPPDLRGAFVPPGAMPINVNTQGIPESYQSMGVLRMGEGGELLPLYGRRNGRGSDIYNYYTRTDTYNPVQIPVSFGRRDCTDDMGCKEVSDGDKVKVYGKGEGTVKLYSIDAPKYIPGVV
jgi:hypothetical protein